MVLVVSTGRDGAFAQLRTWAEERALIRFDFRLIRFALCMRARIRELRADRIEFFSDDTFGEVSLPLGPDLEFALGDFTKEPPDDAATYGKCLAIYIPVPNNKPEEINLIEVKED